MTAPLLIERVGAVAHLILNRPALGNAMSVEMAQGLLEASTVCDEDEDIRCVLLSARGRMFCVGGDIAEFAAAGDAMSALVKRSTAYLHTAVARFSRMGKPLITAINGPAAGAGFSLAILGDMVLAARSANFTVAYTAIGLTPDGGASWLLPRLIGLRRAQELVLSNRRLNADEAAASGLVTRVVEDEALMSEALALAEQLAAAATPALGLARKLLLQSSTTTLETQMESEAQAISAASRTPQGREGVAAFMAKRKPEFWKPQGKRQQP
ncbi:MAG TPA: enoyl-CoA hydratase-related protein [Burkholderiaceae bacterium]|jgi:2-(1,2-epoxy-1,2-dihydrophenyl)acetyl-CoA isomerase